MNTDAHATAEMDCMQDGIVQVRRAWLTVADVFTTARLRKPSETSLCSAAATGWKVGYLAED